MAANSVHHQPAQRTGLVRSVIDLSIGLVDRVVSPETRRAACDNISEFAIEHPLMTAFLSLQVFFNTFPVLVCLAFILAVLGVSFGAALLFSAFWIMVALVVLMPVLLITASVGFFIFSWVAATYMVGRFVLGLIVAKPDDATIISVKKERSHGD